MRQDKKTLPYKRLSPREYLRRYLEVTPLSLAVHRAIEAKNIAGVRMEPPILDLGCGFGEFAGVFFEGKVDLGIDISSSELARAAKSGNYKRLIQADARSLPLESNRFGTVLSVSTLEHIKGVEKAVAEAFRVLRPGGKFVFTINSSKIDEYLFWPKVLKKWGFFRLAKKYSELYHGAFSHKSLWGPRRWASLLAKAGFKTEKMQEILSPEATAHFDRFLVTGWPSQLAKPLVGKRWVWRPGWLREWLVRRYAHLVERDEEEGSNLFVVAVKPSL